MNEEARKNIQRRHLLFDTDVLVDAITAGGETDRLFNLLFDAECIPVYAPFTKFEWLKSAHTKKSREVREEFFKAFKFQELPSRPTDVKIFDTAVEIANAYQRCGISGASLVDCLSAAMCLQMRDLMVVTQNHKDFPTVLFDLVYLHPLDDGARIHSIGFYDVNQGKSKGLGLLK